MLQNDLLDCGQLLLGIKLDLGRIDDSIEVVEEAPVDLEDLVNPEEDASHLLLSDE